MASSFAAQLSRIAATSSHELDIRTRRKLHSESLLYAPEIAAKQDFDTIYTICQDGYQELCRLDARFLEFERNVFSPQSKEQDRDSMIASDNQALDEVIDRILGLFGSRILLNPAVRSLEWLVRRFRIHVHNSSSLLLTVLPYYEMPIWRNVLSIIPASQLVATWKWVAPYKSDSLNVPRHTIVYAATNNDGFWTKMNSHVVGMAREGYMHSRLLDFWTGVAVEAVSARLSAAKSGRQEVQRQNMEDALLKILPIVSDGFDVPDCPEFTTALFTITMVLAAKAEVAEHVFDSILLTVATAAQRLDSDFESAAITISVIAAQKRERKVPRVVIDLFANTPRFEQTLQNLASQYSIDGLLEAFVVGALSSVRKKSIVPRTRFVESILRLSATVSPQVALRASVQATITKALELSPLDDVQEVFKTSLIEMLQRLNEEGLLALVLSDETSDMTQQRLRIEGLLQSTLTMVESVPETMETMEIDMPQSTEPSVDSALSAVPANAAEELSLLATHASPLFEQLAQAFLLCSGHKDTLLRFTSLPIWSSVSTEHLLLTSFVLRFSIGYYNAYKRVIAVNLLNGIIGTSPGKNFQNVLPYMVVLLNDGSKAVRRAASDIIIAIDTSLTQGRGDQSFDQQKLYSRQDMNSIKLLSKTQLSTILQQAFVPVLEECTLDSQQIFNVVRSSLQSSSQAAREGMKPRHVELKPGLKGILFELLANHALLTPVLKLRLSLVTLLATVHKVGTTTTSKTLTPILESWLVQDDGAAKLLADSENLILSECDATIALLVSPKDKDLINHIFSALEGRTHHVRPGFIDAFHARLQSIWKSLKHDTQAFAALKLFALCFSGDGTVSTNSRNLLTTVDFDTQTLGAMLEQAVVDIAQMQVDGQQSRKRRRTSHGRESLPPDLAQTLDLLTSRLTLALELIESSNPKKRAELTPLLFDLLGTLKRLSAQNRFDSPYMLNTCLRNILAIIDGQKSSSRPTIDFSSIRPELVTDCIRSSDNVQVQHTALLLSASLASLAPERMLHEVMPIFTFMGQNIFSKEDDHSIYVVNRAIDEVIPALVSSLRKQNKDVIKSTSGILSSFAAAFDHISQARRIAVYQRLLNRMGFEDFAFVLLSMLSIRKRNNTTFKSFVEDLLAESPTLGQLVTYRKCVSLLNDLSTPDRQLASTILEVNSNSSADEIQLKASLISETALNILHSQSLRLNVSKLHRLKPEIGEAVRQQLNACIQQILTTIRHRGSERQDLEIVKQCLDALLSLPSLSELFDLVPALLKEMAAETDLKSQVLRIVSAKLHARPLRDGKTRMAAMSLLSHLTDVLSHGVESVMKQAIIVCIDRLSEVYGRKDIDTVLAAAIVVSGNECLGSDDVRVKTMSLLNLASIFEVLKESCVPIVPPVANAVVRSLNDVVAGGKEEIYNASYALVTSLATHVPYLIADDLLEALMTISSRSAANYASPSTNESRIEALSTLARKIDLQDLLKAMQGDDLQHTLDDPVYAQVEKLEMLSVAIEANAKSNVMKNAEQISQLLLAHLDQRRVLTGEDNSEELSAVDRVEELIGKVAIHFIYKLNDTVFRPIFETWVDWANSAHDLPRDTQFANSQRARQASLFGLLTHFFTTLKSIVTSYASYIIQPASEILATSSQSSPSASANNKTMLSPEQTGHYTSLLSLLTATFTHDVDAFFSSPSHFTPLGATLVGQLQLVSNKRHRPLLSTHIIPTITALATAVIDTPAHHQTLTHHLVQLRHSPSAAIRLASIQTLAALSTDEALGDEFIANTIGVGSGAGAGVDSSSTGAAATAAAVGSGSSAGELMIYVNEMLEDDDENVERQVRKWVQTVREKVGEDVFEL